MPWTPVALRFRAGTLETCSLTTYCSHRGAAFDLLILVGLSPFNDAYGHAAISPYHPSLALNGGGFPEGFSCHHLNPIRYVVRGASHQPHNAWQAHPRRDQQKHAGHSCNCLNTLNYATSCRGQRQCSPALQASGAARWVGLLIAMVLLIHHLLSDEWKK